MPLPASNALSKFKSHFPGWKVYRAPKWIKIINKIDEKLVATPDKDQFLAKISRDAAADRC